MVLAHDPPLSLVALGRAKWVWDVDRGDGSGERRLKMGVSWTADHRVVEGTSVLKDLQIPISYVRDHPGAELAAFVECWRGYVESPERLIADSI